MLSTILPRVHDAENVSYGLDGGPTPSEYTAQDLSQKTRNKLGQTSGIFICFKFTDSNKFKQTRIQETFLLIIGRLIAIDFGCIKSMPDDFYTLF